MDIRVKHEDDSAGMDSRIKSENDTLGVEWQTQFNPLYDTYSGWVVRSHNLIFKITCVCVCVQGPSIYTFTVV